MKIVKKIFCTMITSMRQDSMQILKNIIFTAIGPNRHIKVFLFGSRARGDNRNRSDIDIALLATERLPQAFMSDLKEKIEESTIPYHVDLIDLASVSQSLREKVLKEGKIWAV